MINQRPAGGRRFGAQKVGQISGWIDPARPRIDQCVRFRDSGNEILQIPGDRVGTKANYPSGPTLSREIGFAQPVVVTDTKVRSVMWSET